MKRISIGIFMILIFFTFSLYFIKNYNTLNQNNFDDEQNNDNGINIKVSSIIGVINLTNYWINNTRHYRNSTVTIEGKLYKPIPPPPPYDNLTGYNVSIVVDGSLDSAYTATSDMDGKFQINYRIPFTMDVFSNHKIEVECIDNLGVDNILSINYFIINVNATSYLEDLIYSDIPYVTGESLALSGYLRYNNDNGTGIPNAQINYNWYNNTYNWPKNSFQTSVTDGSISQSIPIPTDLYSQTLDLNLSYSGNFPYINSSQKLISINVFRDINCEWNTIPKASEGDKVIINGQLSSKFNNTLKINNRTIDIYYDGNYINSTKTDLYGNFSYAYTIPTGTGNKSIQINLVNSGGLSLSSFNIINITQIVIPPSDPTDTEPPFLGFLLTFLPIIIGIVVGLSSYGYYHYRKQDKESKIVRLPLESKILNLKILKDSGRLEESLSYLFNAIYMDLINAKYGRIRNDTKR